jgi:hypothetical protein
MAVRTPPSWLQNGSHPAENDRLTTQALWATTGIIKDTSLVVAQNSPPGMSVLVASGWAAIVGTTQANMGTYVGYNDASTVLTVTTANPTNPRIDRVCMTVQDAYYTGSLNDVIMQVVAGTPSATPVAPALPANSISLATIAVGAGATSITTANITDTRVLVTTNIPESGDISAVVAGTGLSGGGSSGSVTLAINTAVTTDLTTAQTLTNKTIDASTNTLTGVATLTGTQTLTNKTIDASTNTLTGVVTLTGTQTLTNKTLTTPTLNSPLVNVGINTQTGTSYTTVLADNGKLITLDNASTITATIPPFSSVAYPVGAQLNFVQYGTGQVTFTQGSGVTIVSTGASASAPKARTRYSSATAICVAQDNWLIAGDIA